MYMILNLLKNVVLADYMQYLLGIKNWLRNDSLTIYLKAGLIMISYLLSLIVSNDSFALKNDNCVFISILQPHS